jgi:hypothetical protein
MLILLLAELNWTILFNYKLFIYVIMQQPYVLLQK